MEVLSTLRQQRLQPSGCLDVLPCAVGLAPGGVIFDAAQRCG